MRYTVANATRADATGVAAARAVYLIDPAATPDNSDLLNGERLYLRRHDEAIPELQFDDIADGIATVVTGKRDWWRHEFGAPLFFGLAAGVLVVVATALVVGGHPTQSALFSGLLAVLLGGCALWAHRCSR